MVWWHCHALYTDNIELHSFFFIFNSEIFDWHFKTLSIHFCMKINVKYPILKSIIAWQSENVNHSACKVIIWLYWDKIKSVVYFFRCFKETMWMLQNMVDTVEMEYLLPSPRPATLSPSCSAQTPPYSNQDSQLPTANLHLVSLDSMLVFQHWCAWPYTYMYQFY